MALMKMMTTMTTMTTALMMMAIPSEEGRVDICSPEWFHGFMARYIAPRVTS